jgi:alanine dehydrogenase
MSEIAGRLAVYQGCHYLQRTCGGSGVLMSGVAGVGAAKVVNQGAGTVGSNAVAKAVGLGAEVYALDNALTRLRALEATYGSQVKTRMATRWDIERQLRDADLVIGAVLVPGARAPKLVTVDMVKKMKPRSVMIDVSIDQGGTFATSRVTSHDQPTFILHDVVHVCIPNMPAAVPLTATQALCNATLPYLVSIATRGVVGAIGERPELRCGVNTQAGHVTHPAVADALALPYTPLDLPCGLQVV